MATSACVALQSRACSPGDGGIMDRSDGFGDVMAHELPNAEGLLLAKLAISLAIVVHTLSIMFAYFCTAFAHAL